MSETGTRERAREVALARYRLRWHIPVYLLVNVGLVLVWRSTGGGFFWPVFPIIFWGLGVFLHYLNAYRSGGNAWVDRETERIQGLEAAELEGHHAGQSREIPVPKSE